jgi:hypothetical protein
MRDVACQGGQEGVETVVDKGVVQAHVGRIQAIPLGQLLPKCSGLGVQALAGCSCHAGIRQAPAPQSGSAHVGVGAGASGLRVAARVVGIAQMDVPAVVGHMNMRAKV